MTFWKITFTPIFPTKDSTGFITYMIYLTDKGLDNSFAEYATKSKTYGKKWICQIPYFFILISIDLVMKMYLQNFTPPLTWRLLYPSFSIFR